MPIARKGRVAQMIIGYVRVSTVDQNEARQFEALRSHGVEKWFSEKVSGKNMDRPQLQQMLSFAREGDVILVEDWSRLARSTQDLLNIVEQMQAKGVVIKSLKEDFDTSTASGRLMLTLIGAINAFERENTLERQREGIRIAQAAHKYRGRTQLRMPDDFGDYYDRWMKRQMTKRRMAKKLGASRPVVDRWFREYEAGLKEQTVSGARKERTKEKREDIIPRSEN